MLTFTTLASGSGGNAALVSCGDTHLLLDAGISAKQITAGLAALGVAPRDLTAILITHEHSDHVSGLRVLSKRAALAAESGTRAVVLAHLSRENNTPARAWETAARRLRSMGCEPNLDLSLTVAPRSGLGPTYQLESGRVLQASPSGEEAALC